MYLSNQEGEHFRASSEKNHPAGWPKYDGPYGTDDDDEGEDD